MQLNKTLTLFLMCTSLMIACNDDPEPEIIIKDEPDSTIHRELIHNFSSEGFVINCIYVDTKDIKWFGTNQGLYSYDGNLWGTYNDENIALNITALSRLDSKLYIGSKQGVALLKDTDSSLVFITNYNTENSSLHSNEITTIVTHNQKVFFGTTLGLSYLEDETWVGEVDSELRESIINSLTIMEGHFFTTRTNEFLLHGYLEGDFDAVTAATVMSDSFNGRLSTENSFCSAGDENDVYIWYGTEFGLSKTHKNKTHESQNEFEFFLIGEQVQSLAITDKGNVWAGKKSGISHYNGSSWENFTSENGPDSIMYITQFSSATIDTNISLRTQAVNLVDTVINTIAVDKSETIWVGTNNGISSYNNSVWSAH